MEVDVRRGGTGEYVVTWQQLHAHKHPMTTLFELKFNEGYVYLSPLFYRHKVGPRLHRGGKP